MPCVFLLVCLLPVLFLAACQSQPRLRIIAQDVTPAMEAAARDLAAGIELAGYETDVATGPDASAAQVNAVILTVDESALDLEPEGFRILPIRAGGFHLFRVIGRDQRGVLWGSQELAEQILSSGRLATVFTQSANRRLPLRAIGLPLRLPEAAAPLAATPDPRARWREQVALLSRSRFNSIFLRITQPITRIAPIPGQPDEPEALSPELRAHADWMRELFAIARDRGLDCYLWITPESVPVSGEESPPADPAVESLSPEISAPDSSLANILPAILSFYPEVAGIVLDPGLIPPGDPSARNLWIAGNVLAPLADSDDHRPVFLGLGSGSWPVRDELAALAPDARLRLISLLPASAEPLPDSDYPVLWTLDLPPSELRPWEDPAAAGTALRRIGARNSLGFLDVSLVSPIPSAASADQTLDLADSWFRLLLLGRLGYSPDLPEQYWVQQFARRFGPRAGLQVYAAASHGNRILESLHRQAASVSFPPSDSALSSRMTDPESQFSLLRSFLMEQREDFSAGEVLTEVLEERDWLLPGQPSPSEPAAASLETEANEALALAADAGRLGAWRNPANQPLLQRIQAVADAGMALVERRRSALALARFLLTGNQDDRQQALDLLESVQQRMAAAGSQLSSSGRPGLLDPFATQTAAVLQAIPHVAPWQWHEAAWEVGAVDGWNPILPEDVPAPFLWTAAQTRSLREFGLFGLQLWMGALNQQLRPAFLTPAAASFVPGSSAGLFVARTRISIPSSGQLILRLLAGQPATVWINGSPASSVSTAQFPWPVGSPPSPSLLVQLFAHTVPPGDAEVIVSVPATAAAPPVLALQSSFTPQARVPLPVSAAAASELAGGVVLAPPAAGSLQPHLAFAGPTDGEEASEPGAVFPFALRDPGFYRIRLWCFWDAPPRSGLALELDGSPLGGGIGKDDPTTGRWHWVPVDTVAALGPGEHRLRVTGWTANTRVGIVEISQQDALPPGS